MPRSARLVVPEHPFHLTHRGNNKQKVFYSDDDRRKYLFWLKEACQEWKMGILSFCLMDNHVHFIAIAHQLDSFAKVINVVHRRYAIYLNQKNGSSGHLWEGRYYSCLLDRSHLIAALRYVERNPVRAHMVSKPWDWVWSSAREHVGKGRGHISLENVPTFVPMLSWEEYIDQAEQEEDLDEIRKQTMSLKAWADLDFKESIENKYGIQLTPKLRGRPCK